MNILISGEGGQGVQLIAEILAVAAIENGKEATYIPNFGVEQRGGVSLAFVIIDDQPISYPKFLTADILLYMCERAKARTQHYCGPKTVVFDATHEDLQKLPQKVHNMYMLGKLVKVLNTLSLDVVKTVLVKKLGDKFQKNPQLKEDNFKALDRGYSGI